MHQLGVRGISAEGDVASEHHDVLRAARSAGRGGGAVGVPLEMATRTAAHVPLQRGELLQGRVRVRDRGSGLGCSGQGSGQGSGFGFGFGIGFGLLA